MTSALNTAIGVGVGVAAIAGGRIPASLRCIDLPTPGFVPFDFNPEKITFSRSSTVSNQQAPPRPGSRSTGVRNPTKAIGSTIKIGQVTFAGPLTKLFCDTLLTWMIPSTGLLAMLGLKGFTTQPAKLTFQWGPPMVGFMYDCKITQCTVNYTRFSAIGIPLRAQVDLQLQEIPSLLGSLPTNPTSGGLPGRRSHTVGHGETLQSIATEKYGRPGLWRRIAEVNNIQDPGRVRPGTTIYLPNPDELTAGAAR
jgi:Contractile injection system tube protein/LysM domain